MQYKEFKDGIKLSRLGMGAMRLPVSGSGEGSVDYEKAKEVIDQAYRGGINYFDTAYIYHGGKSEVVLGNALREYPRESYYIADKFNYQADPDYRAQFAEQLRRLGMDYIDFYLLHGIQDAFADDLLSSGCIAYFDGLKKEGKIRYLGFSFHGSEKTLLRLLDAYPFEFVQIQLNYYDWEYGNAKRFYEILTERKIPVMVMEPVHGGLLAKMNPPSEQLLREQEPDSSLASWAMRWIMSLENVQVALSGMTTPEQMQDNLRTFSENRTLGEAEKELLTKAARLLCADVALPCTSCRYCVPNCPMELDIPLLLRFYNEMKVSGAWRLGSLLGVPEEKRPTACISCGNCTAHCPQSLAIPDAMKEMAGYLERK